MKILKAATDSFKDGPTFYYAHVSKTTFYYAHVSKKTCTLAADTNYQGLIPDFLYPVVKMFPNISGWKKLDEVIDFIREVVYNHHCMKFI